MGIILLLLFMFSDIILHRFSFTRSSGDIVRLGVLVFFICIGFAAAHFTLYALRTLQVEREIFNLTGKPETKDFTTLIQDFKKEGRSFAKRLQGTTSVQDKFTKQAPVATSKQEVSPVAAEEQKQTIRTNPFVQTNTL